MTAWFVAWLVGAHLRVPARQTRASCQSQTAGVRCADDVTVAGDPIARAGGRPLASASLSRDDLRRLGPNVATWLDFALKTAGANLGHTRLRVDGMPAVAEMSARSVARVTVNDDPFSAAADGVDDVLVDVELAEPSRDWRGSLEGPSFGRGGGDRLTNGAMPQLTRASGDVGGPLSASHLTFSSQASYDATTTTPAFVSASTGIPTAADATTSEIIASASLTSSYSAPRLRVRAVFGAGRTRLQHAGIGAIVAPEAGTTSSSDQVHAQFVWHAVIGSRVHSGGVTWRVQRTESFADSTGPSVVITGQQVSGPSAIAWDADRSMSWTAQHVVEPADRRRSWLLGVEGGRDQVESRRLLNPFGVVQRSSAGDNGGIRFVTRGVAQADVHSYSAAVFGERVLIDAPAVTARGGLRVDWQKGYGLLVLPRLTARVEPGGGIHLSGGAGVFADHVDPALLADVQRRDGTSAGTLMITQIATADSDQTEWRQAPLTARFAPDFRPRRDLVARVGALRAWGHWAVGVDETVTRGMHLAGSDRERDSGALIDTVDSDRRLLRGLTQIRATATWPGQWLAIFYEHARSHDDSGGALMFPQRSAEIAAEWSRSARVASHSVGVAACLSVPWAMRLLVSVTIRSGQPFNALSGLDSQGLGTFSDRGGASRNAALAPATRDVSASLSRSVTPARWKGVTLQAGIRIENALNATNAWMVGQVLQTASFGRPIAAAPARAARVWLTAGR